MVQWILSPSVSKRTISTEKGTLGLWKSETTHFLIILALTDQEGFEVLIAEIGSKAIVWRNVLVETKGERMIEYLEWWSVKEEQ